MIKAEMRNWRSHSRLLRNMGGKLSIMILLVAAAFGVIWLDSCVIQPGQSMGRVDRPGRGVSIRTEATHVWLPESLVALARERSRDDSMIALSCEELKVALERRHLQDVWYAFTLRSFQADGGSAEITYIRRPYREFENFREIPEILARAAGMASPTASSRFTAAEVHVLSRAQSQQEPRQLMDQLIASLTQRPKFMRGSK